MMFSSPAVRIFSAENTDVGPKKPGATNTTSRQPFIDRDVNNSPAMAKNPKCVSPRVDLKVSTVKDEDLFFYDTCSVRDVEDERQDLSVPEIVRILRSYCGFAGSKTPPPTPPPKFSSDFHNMFVEMPPAMVFNPKLLEENVGDIELPQIDFDDYV